MENTCHVGAIPRQETMSMNDKPPLQFYLAFDIPIQLSTAKWLCIAQQLAYRLMISQSREMRDAPNPVPRSRREKLSCQKDSGTIMKGVYTKNARIYFNIISKYAIKFQL
jgi:hypothetical protein